MSQIYFGFPESERANANMESTMVPPKESESEPIVNDTPPSIKLVVDRSLPPLGSVGEEVSPSSELVAAETTQSNKPTTVRESLSSAQPASERPSSTQPAPAFNYIPVQSPYLVEIISRVETISVCDSVSATVALVPSPKPPAWPSEPYTNQRGELRHLTSSDEQPETRSEIHDVERGEVEKESLEERKGVRVLKNMLVTLGEVWTSFRDWWFG
ncbi:hypothetical protein TWF694_003845 [Orbilia ellipsospora]|uniref:Uncharacterized protein n=1 Tax=Orbilia ellipsospora TaxID=2528407 RepID=A0AAV9WZQ7_9PEZI